MSHSRLCIAQFQKWGALPVFALGLVFMLATTADAQLFEIRAGAESYQVEVAKTPDQRRRGLMRRAELDRHQGMLLVYRRVGDHRIWMKNMRIALRVYWIDSDARVIDMQRLEPCQADPCPVYSASQPSLYVLELSDYDHALKPGDRIEGLTDL